MECFAICAIVVLSACVLMDWRTFTSFRFWLAHFSINYPSLGVSFRYRLMSCLAHHCSQGTSSSPMYTWNHDFRGRFSENVTIIYRVGLKIGRWRTINIGLACPRLFVPFSMPFHSTSTRSAISCSISLSATPGCRQILL